MPTRSIELVGGVDPVAPETTMGWQDGIVLWTADAWPKLVDGSITLTFRRWKRPQARAGGTSRTPVGILAIRFVDVVPVAAITDEEAQRAGFTTRARLIEYLGGEHGDVHRVAFEYAGADPRIALRERRPDAVEIAAINEKLERLDRASSIGPWTRATLEAIASWPGVRAGDLAERMGRDRASFKLDVRKLKALGLTESLEVGYRLAPRGETILTPSSGSPLIPSKSPSRRRTDQR